MIRVADIGGTKITVADVDGERVTILKKCSIKDSSYQDIIDLIVPHTQVCAGIAVSCAGVIYDNDLVFESPNLKQLNEHRLGVDLSLKGGVPAVVVNDMFAEAFGILTIQPSWGDFVVVNWGSGLNAAIAKNGYVISPGEAGHMTINFDSEGDLCGCTQLGKDKVGHAESYLGSRPLAIEVIRSAMNVGINIPHDDPMPHFDNALDRHEEWAQALAERISKPMAAFLANLVTIVRPKMIVWRGTIGIKTLPRIEEYVRAAMKTMLIDESWSDKDNLPFLPSPNPEHDAIIGAAEYLIQENSE